MDAPMPNEWARIREAIERHGSASLVSVVMVVGSGPREAGARIVVRPDGGFFGSIGGGRLEYETLAGARAALAAGRGKAEFRDWPLGPNLGQCCGGMVTTLTETFDTSDLATVRQLEEAEKAGPFTVVSRLGDDGRIARDLTAQAKPTKTNMRVAVTGKASFSEQFGEARTPLLLFGAGHVGRALVLALAPLPFTVRWIDNRPDQFPQFLPPNVVAVHSEAYEEEIAAAPDGAFAIVMTHSHPLDYDITAAVLKRGKFGFVGLIGSQTKRARFASFVRKLGLPDDAIERLVCPIGIPGIKGKQPPVIAAAVTAQILAARE